MSYTDDLGYTVSTTSADALEAYELGVSHWLRWRGGAVEALDRAVEIDPHFALGHCTRAYVAWRMGRVDVALDAHQKAMALADEVQDERERMHLQIVDAMQSHDGAATMHHLQALAKAYPSDRMGMRVLSFNYIARGDYQGGLEQARRSLAACPNDPEFLTMAAFFLEQSNADRDAGLDLGLQSLNADPGNLYTYHAVGHNYQSRGDYAKAVATFERANSLERVPHNIWHLAEAQAILGDTRITQDYWESSAPPLPLFERIELQWRREIVRGEPVVPSVWRALAAEGEKALDIADDLTIWMHHWIGLAFARAGETDKAQQQLTRLRGLPEGQASGHWSTLGADLFEGEMALMREDVDTAVGLMAAAVARIHDMGGGSREQKDIFQDVLMALHRRLGHIDAVSELAQRRLALNPNHFQSLAAQAWVYGQTGQSDLQQRTYEALMSRAKQMPVCAQAPAFVEAQTALQAA